MKEFKLKLQVCRICKWDGLLWFTDLREQHVSLISFTVGVMYKSIAMAPVHHTFLSTLRNFFCPIKLLQATLCNSHLKILAKTSSYDVCRLYNDCWIIAGGDLIQIRFYELTNWELTALFNMVCISMFTSLLLTPQTSFGINKVSIYISLSNLSNIILMYP